MNKKKKLAILIPAHNEEVVIEKTLASILRVMKKENVYLVSDGSTDDTVKIGRTKLPHGNVLDIRKNKGKANAINYALTKFKLATRYSYIMPIDADTKLTKDFKEKVFKIFKNDKKHEVACVVGKVVGESGTWITRYRQWEYEVAQSIYKNAQDKIGTIIVNPGCSTVYRSELLKKLPIPVGTVTEDMDHTFEIQRRKLGKIKFANDAHVVTQDPRTLKDFIKQLDRWYSGFWQCVLKHNVPWGGQIFDAEVALMAIEGLVNSLASASLIAILFFLRGRYGLLIYPLLFDLFLFLIPTMILFAIKRKTFVHFLLIPQFYFLRFLSAILFLKSFIKVALATKFRLQWNTKRYGELERRTWFNQLLR